MENAQRQQVNMEMESFLEADGSCDEEIKEKERKRKKYVSGTVDLGCDGCFRCLSLSLRPFSRHPCRETPVMPYLKMSPEFATSQSLPTTSSAGYIVIPHQQIAQGWNRPYDPSESSSSSSPPPKRIHSPPPLPVWAIPRHSRNRGVVQRDRKPDLAVAPYEWATKRRATVHKLDYLVSEQILVISGEVQCRKCKASFEIRYDLVERFKEIGFFINQNDGSMLDRAPSNWMSPSLPDCMHCRAERSVAPCISGRKRLINWLFLFLGEMIGCCKLAHLKYFCKQNDELRTGAKDRVVYSTYIEMCKQLDPTGESFLSLIK